MILKAKSIYGTEHQLIEIEDSRIVRTFSDDAFPPEQIDETFDGHIYPAFTDTHMHIIGYGMLLSELSLDSATDIPTAMEMLRAYAPTCTKPVITGRNWNQDRFAEKRLLQRDDLDAVCPDRPVALRRVCGHIAVLNTAALMHYGLLSPSGQPTTLADRYPDEIDRNVAGLPTGVLRENALDLLNEPYTDAELIDFIDRAQDRLLAYGIAAVHSDDLYFREDPTDIPRLFARLAAEGSLHVRIYEQSRFGALEAVRTALEEGYQQDRSGSLAWFKHGAMKILSDGSLGARTARLSQPYCDDSGNRGLLVYPQHELREMLELAARFGVDTVSHGIGDETIRILIEAREGIITASGAPRGVPARGRDAIVHCQIMHPDQIAAMAKLGYHALVQPCFLGYDATIVKDRVGETLARTSYAYRSMLDAGIRLAFGSDAPVEDPNPLRSIYHAVEAPLYPDEALTVDEAIRGFTSEAAFFAYEEGARGVIAPGFAADLCIMERRIAPPILDNKVLATYVHGVKRYRRSE